MVSEADVVIGANYGDEGKGLATDWLCRKAVFEGKKCINVLTNGGCQRGHTVVNDKGRFVFSHLGSACHICDTYFSHYYMINPMVFCEEIERVQPGTDILADSFCLVTLPYDMLYNRALKKGKNESCGYGINETLERSKRFPIYFNELGNYSSMLEHIKFVRDSYYDKIIKENNIVFDDGMREIFYSDTLVDNFIEDCLFMYRTVKSASINEVITDYDVAVFENAQGLLLDKDIDVLGTPTNTGSDYAKELLNSYDIKPDLYYISRTYLTRHGAGKLPSECSKEEINPFIDDKTNVTNEYQGSLRYGKLVMPELLDRIKQDAGDSKYYLVLTHCNEYYDKDWDAYADFISDTENTVQLAPIYYKNRHF